MFSEIDLARFELGPRLIQSLCRLATPDLYDLAPDPERFSFRADVAHLNEVEPYFLARLKQIASHPGSETAPFDIDSLPGVASYGSADPLQSSAEFAKNRRATFDFCQALPEAAFANVGIHPMMGEMRLLDWIRYMIGHDLYHAEHMAKIIELRKA